MKLRRTRKFRYPKSRKPRLFYGCSTWPKCSEVIGAHPDGRPLGIPVSKEYRMLRHKLHVNLGKDYRDWLVKNLGISKAQAHIGMLSESQIDDAFALLEKKGVTDEDSNLH